MITDLLSLYVNEAQRFSSSARDLHASLPNLRPPAPDRVVLYCGGGGSCPTLYEYKVNHSLIFQGYPPSSSDEVAVCATTQEPAVALPAAFFQEVINWGLNYPIPLRHITDPESPIWGPPSGRYHIWRGGDVVVRGTPIKGELQEMLQVPDGEVAIEISNISFVKLIRDCLRQAQL